MGCQQSSPVEKNKSNRGGALISCRQSNEEGSHGTRQCRLHRSNTSTPLGHGTKIHSMCALCWFSQREPLYQIYLQTEAIVFPADRAPAEATYVWERETFAVAENKNEAKFEESPGYFAPPDVERSIIDFFRKVLQVEPEQAKVLPYSEERSTVGKRLSRHPLHDAFIGEKARSVHENFYAKSNAGMLIPDIREDSEPGKSRRGAEPLTRVQRVFTMPLKELLALWEATAQR
jgi:hypothetical protein